VILHPGVLALLAGSLLSAALVAGAAWHGAGVLRRWDLASGSALQLALERRTYLVATLVRWALAFELAALFLLVHVADALAPLLAGAMCAAGTFAADGFGYPALALRLGTFVVGGVWLVVNHADELGHDYPLLRTKYALLLVLAPLVLLGAAVQARFFLGLQPEVITSCCGSLFSRGGGTLGAGLAALPPGPTAAALWGTAGGAALAGAAHARWGGGALAAALAVLSGLALLAGIAGVVSFVSPYVYELPAHRCPFCLLRPEYGRAGYVLYAALLAGAVCGIGAGALQPFRAVPSLAGALPRLQRRLAVAAAAAFALFAALAAWEVLASHLVA
jgi:hypothetical protein